MTQSSGTDSIDIFIEQQRIKDALPEAQPNRLRFRLRAGLLLGLVLGLCYALAAQNINEIANPGLPLAHAPFGRIGNMVPAILAGILLGGLVAWPRLSSGGIGVTALTFAVLMVLRSFLFTGVQNPFGYSTPLLYAVFTFGSLLLWTIFGFLPVGLLRWAVDDQREQAAVSWRAPVRWRMAAAIATMGLAAGVITSLLPADTLVPLNWIHTTIQQGQKAATQAELPPALRPVDDFLAHRGEPYIVEMDDTLAVIQEISFLGKSVDTLVLARYESGWTLACLLPFAGDPPLCKGYSHYGH
jgi:hypothetical protein